MQISGVEHHSGKAWAPCLHNLETSLKQFLAGINRCRAQCSYPYDQKYAEEKVSIFLISLKAVNFAMTA